MLLFISDLHLSPQAPGVTRIFLDFLGGRARNAEHLYILGDLFEVWVGDDGIDDPDDGFNRQIVSALRALTDSGVKLSVLHGNRDFLLGEEFAARSGARLLPDPFVLSLPTWQFVLSHGDLLCTDDVAYQQFRRQVRTPEWQAAFLARPLAERQAMARQMREHSEAHHAAQGVYAHIDAELARRWLAEAGAITLIHGHTHQPGDHALGADAAGRPLTQVVLSDWHVTAAERRTQVLRLTPTDGLQRVTPRLG